MTHGWLVVAGLTAMVSVACSRSTSSPVPNADPKCPEPFERLSEEKVTAVATPGVAIGVDPRSGFVFWAAAFDDESTEQGRVLGQLAARLGESDRFRTGLSYYVRECSTGAQFSIALTSGWGLHVRGPSTSISEPPREVSGIMQPQKLSTTAQRMVREFTTWISAAQPKNVISQYVEEDEGDAPIQVGWNGKPIFRKLDGRDLFGFWLAESKAVNLNDEILADGDYFWTKQLEGFATVLGYADSDEGKQLLANDARSRTELDKYLEARANEVVAVWKAAPSTTTKLHRIELATWGALLCDHTLAHNWAPPAVQASLCEIKTEYTKLTGREAEN